MVVKESVYSGSQLMPHVDVYYSDNAALVAQAQTQKLLLGINRDFSAYYGGSISSWQTTREIVIM